MATVSESGGLELLVRTCSGLEGICERELSAAAKAAGVFMGPVSSASPLATIEDGEPLGFLTMASAGGDADSPHSVRAMLAQVRTLTSAAVVVRAIALPKTGALGYLEALLGTGPDLSGKEGTSGAGAGSTATGGDAAVDKEEGPGALDPPLEIPQLRSGGSFRCTGVRYGARATDLTSVSAARCVGAAIWQRHQRDGASVALKNYDVNVSVDLVGSTLVIAVPISGVGDEAGGGGAAAAGAGAGAGADGTSAAAADGADGTSKGLEKGESGGKGKGKGKSKSKGKKGKSANRFGPPVARTPVVYAMLKLGLDQVVLDNGGGGGGGGGAGDAGETEAGAGGRGCRGGGLWDPFPGDRHVLFEAKRSFPAMVVDDGDSVVAAGRGRDGDDDGLGPLEGAIDQLAKVPAWASKRLMKWIVTRPPKHVECGTLDQWYG